VSVCHVYDGAHTRVETGPATVVAVGGGACLSVPLRRRLSGTDRLHIVLRVALPSIYDGSSSFETSPLGPGMGPATMAHRSLLAPTVVQQAGRPEF
jgi:hypothetical protein